MERRSAIARRRPFSTTAYRYPHEQLILGITLLLVFLVIALTATATLCLSAVFVIALVALSYSMTRSNHRALLEGALRVTPERTPALAALTAATSGRLQPGPVDIFVVPSKTLNAYTFGLSSPKVVVLQSPLLDAMDREELAFVLGHELGHVRLGHTWLNSLVGGMAGIPSPFLASVVLGMAFLWWNRACEYSADRAGLLACGDLRKAASALVKLAAGERAPSRADLEQALRHIEAEDDDVVGRMSETLATHPLMIRRLEKLRRYAASSEYRRLQERMDQNVVA